MLVEIRNDSLCAQLARMMARYGGVGFRGKSRPGGPLAEAQGREEKLARMMAPLESNRYYGKISSRSSYRCAK